MKRIIITGEIQSGKTTLAAALVDSLRLAGFSITGWLALGLWRDNQRWGFDLLNLKNGAVTPLARRSEGELTAKTTPFIFNEAALTAGRAMLQDTSCHDAQFIFIDEVGKLEMAGEGWAPCLTPLLEVVSRPDPQPETTLIWIVRQNLVEAVKRRWVVPMTSVVNVEMPDALKRLQSLCSCDD